MGKGILTGKMTKERVNAMAPDDHRRNDPDFQEPRIDAHLQLVESLRPIAEAQGRSLAQLAIAWVLRRNEVTAAIAGARRPEQIEDTAKASDWRLSPHEIEKVGELLEKHEGIAAV
jgi:aryl-alcohol dehydrogenase-like predicted oxidoreductase